MADARFDSPQPFRNVFDHRLDIIEISADHAESEPYEAIRNNYKWMVAHLRVQRYHNKNLHTENKKLQARVKELEALVAAAREVLEWS